MIPQARCRIRISVTNVTKGMGMGDARARARAHARGKRPSSRNAGDMVTDRVSAVRRRDSRHQDTGDDRGGVTR